MKHYGEGSYKMVDKEGQEYLLTVEREEYPMDPREWSLVTKMICWHRRYKLGDEHNYDNPQEFFTSLILENDLEQRVVEDARNGKIDGITITNEDCEEGTVYISIYEYGVFCDERYIFDDIRTDIPINYMQELLNDYALIVPLYLYEHGGITISTGSFGDPWDSGQVGYIYINKEDAMKKLQDYKRDEYGNHIKRETVCADGWTRMCYATKPMTEEGWRIRAKEEINNEVEEYDSYLRGDCYRYTLEEKVHIRDEKKCPHCGEVIEIEEYDDWEEVNSNCGYYGDALEDNGILDDVDLEFAD